eukprot:gene33168-40925_t
MGPKRKAKFIRSAGTSGLLIFCGPELARIKMPSEKILEVPKNCYATVGQVSNVLHNKVVLGKAGRNRHLGWRPHVRGIAMNPVDHPHGGRGNGGRPSCTPWGFPCKSGFSLVKRRKVVRLAKEKIVRKMKQEKDNGRAKAAAAAAAAAGAPYAITPPDHVKYHGLFVTYDTDKDGLIQRDAAIEVFRKSGLPEPVLLSIFALADDDHDGVLAPKEFCV